MKEKIFLLILSLLVLALAVGVSFAEETGSSPGDRFLQRFDEDKDGKVSKDEFPGRAERFDRVDENQDGFIEKSEINKRPPGGGRGASMGPPSGGRPPGFPPREDKGPKVGDVAPPFKLASLDGKEEFELNTFKGARPVVLLFGSYT
jgi:hypothetical protein